MKYSLLFIVVSWITFCMLNLVSHCNNGTIYCLLDDTMTKYTLSYQGEPRLHYDKSLGERRCIHISTWMCLFCVVKNQYSGMVVTQVEARDGQATDERVTYHFLHGNTLTSTTPEFGINQITGVVTARVTFDRETRDVYSVSCTSFLIKW